MQSLFWDMRLFLVSCAHSSNQFPPALTAFLLTLSNGFLLNLELGWQPKSPSNLLSLALTVQLLETADHYTLLQAHLHTWHTFTSSLAYVYKGTTMKHLCIEKISIPALILRKEKCWGFELMSSSLLSKFSPAEISHLFIQSVHFKKS